MTNYEKLIDAAEKRHDIELTECKGGVICKAEKCVMIAFYWEHNDSFTFSYMTPDVFDKMMNDWMERTMAGGFDLPLPMFAIGYGYGIWGMWSCLFIEKRLDFDTILKSKYYNLSHCGNPDGDLVYMLHDPDERGAVAIFNNLSIALDTMNKLSDEARKELILSPMIANSTPDYIFK